MKRLIVGATVVAAATGMLLSQPVHADEPAPQDNANLGHWLNPILGLIPGPEGWQQRSVCAGTDQSGKAYCLYFPFPI
jgi:hypothetical protein